MRAAISTGLMTVGALFILVAALGVLRMPDLFLRMSATAKAGTLGAICILLGAAVAFADLGIAARVIATIAFLLLTSPVAAHMIGRAAYVVGVPLWRGTVHDDLRGRYDRGGRRLISPPRPAGHTDPDGSTAERVG
jgi:multicomponent Na+:H+ antiporter subunit G